MSNPKILMRRKLAVILAGGLFIVIGMALWLFTDFVIQGHEQILSNPDLIQEEKWRWEGSLQWWTTAETTCHSTSIILITIGVCAIELTLLHTILQPERRTETSQTLLSQYL